MLGSEQILCAVIARGEMEAVSGVEHRPLSRCLCCSTILCGPGLAAVPRSHRLGSSHYDWTAVRCALGGFLGGKQRHPAHPAPTPILRGGYVRSVQRANVRGIPPDKRTILPVDIVLMRTPAQGKLFLSVLSLYDAPDGTQGLAQVTECEHTDRDHDDRKQHLPSHVHL